MFSTCILLSTKLIFSTLSCLIEWLLICLFLFNGHARYRFECDVCGLRTVEKSKFDEHMKRHRGECRDVQVNSHNVLCPSIVTMHPCLQFHALVYLALGERDVVCEVCGKAFISDKDLSNHMRYHTEPKDRPFKCALCPHTAVSAWKLKRHQTTHLIKVRLHVSAKSLRPECIPLCRVVLVHVLLEYSGCCFQCTNTILEAL